MPLPSVRCFRPNEGLCDAPWIHAVGWNYWEFCCGPDILGLPDFCSMEWMKRMDGDSTFECLDKLVGLAQGAELYFHMLVASTKQLVGSNRHNPLNIQIA